MKLLRVLTIVVALVFAVCNTYAQQPPPVDSTPEEQVLSGPPTGPPVEPPGGTAVPLDGGMLMALLVGGGLFAGLVRKGKKDKLQD